MWRGRNRRWRNRPAKLRGNDGAHRAMDSKIRDTNPFYNGRKLKLGSFSINLEHGGAASTIDGTHKADWPSIKALASCMTTWSSRRSCRWRAGAASAGDELRRPRLRDLYVCGRRRRADELPCGGRHLARAAGASDHGRQADDHHRSHQRRPRGAQYRHRLEPAGDRDVRHSRCASTTSVTKWRWNGSRSSSGCGPRARISITRGASTRSTRATLSRSRSRSPIRRS